MKKLLLILLCLPFIGFGQLTYVPDDSFEAYLEANGMGDGIVLNDYVLAGNINTVTSLNLNSQNIADLTGIEDFTALTWLSCIIKEHATNKEFLKLTDLFGREIKGTKNEVLFYIYDDGIVEKRIVIE